MRASGTAEEARVCAEYNIKIMSLFATAVARERLHLDRCRSALGIWFNLGLCMYICIKVHDTKWRERVFRTCTFIYTVLSEGLGLASRVC